MINSPFQISEVRQKIKLRNSRSKLCNIATLLVNTSSRDLNIGIGKIPIKHNTHEEEKGISKHVGRQKQNSKETETVKQDLEKQARFIKKHVQSNHNNLLDKFTLENNGVGIWQNLFVNHRSQAELSQQCHTDTGQKTP